MKTKLLSSLFAFAFTGMAVPLLTAQEVPLGNVTFAETSDVVPPESYWSMSFDVVRAYSGFGDYEGFTRTRKCNNLVTQAGVKCLKLSIDTGSGLEGVESIAEANGDLVTTSEAFWLAVDTAGNLRVLKQTRGDAVVFEASESATPPVLFPATPVLNQSWEALGKKFTVESVDATSGEDTGLLKIKVESAVPAAPAAAPPIPAPAGAPAGEPETATAEATPAPTPTVGGTEYAYYKAGSGLVRSESSVSEAASGTGWAVKNP